MKVFWTPTAYQSYEAVVDQLILNWNVDIVVQFEESVRILIDHIQNHNHICPKSKIDNLHKCVISKHNSLIYRIKNNDTIEIILIIFNQSEHIF